MTKSKIVFLLEQDETGYPPVSSERLWVDLLDDDSRARLDNIPFFERVATLGDIIEYVRKDGELQYVSTLQRSGNSLIRAVCYPGADPAALRRTIESFGCETEFDANHGIIAINIPPNGHLSALQAFLQAEEDKGIVGYEEPILMKGLQDP